MRLLLLVSLLLAGCDVFRAGNPQARLTRDQFVQVYVELARANTPSERQAILKKHKTSEKELQEFVQAYTADLAELSAAFDSALAKLASPSSGLRPDVEPQ